jgi:hypothetical protein
MVRLVTSHGAATMLHLPNPIASPTGPMGVILWGRCDRIPTLTVALSLASSKAVLWIADYSPKEKAAIIVWSADPVIVGERVEFNTNGLSENCPKCHAGDPVSNGARLWRCKNCGRQWNKTRSLSGAAIA